MRTWALSHEYVLIWVDLLAGRKRGVQLDIASIPDVFDAKAEESGTVLQQSWHIDFIWSCRHEKNYIGFYGCPKCFKYTEEQDKDNDIEIKTPNSSMVL